MKIYSPKPYPLDLDPAWASEFRAFFMGEGCAQMARRKRKGLTVWIYQPSLHIRLREDERPLIDDIVAHLGGQVTSVPARTSKQGYVTNPALFWSLVNYPRVRSVIEATDLCNPLLPAHKRLDIRLLYEAILARYTMPYWRLGEENRAILADFREKMILVRKYVPSRL